MLRAFSGRFSSISPVPSLLVRPQRSRRHHMDTRNGLNRPMLGAAAFLLAFAVASCDEKLSDLTGPTPNLQPTFSSIQHEIFETTDSSGRPACTNCHTNVGRN